MRDISLKKYRLSRYASIELKAFCRQYPEKLKEANTLLTISSPVLNGMPHGNAVSSPVERAAERREKLLSDIAIIEAAAAETQNGRFRLALIQNACYGTCYECIQPEFLPTSNRNAFFEARREFFYVLYKKRNPTV